MTEDADALVALMTLSGDVALNEKTGNCPVIDRVPHGGYFDMDTAALASSKSLVNQYWSDNAGPDKASLLHTWQLLPDECMCGNITPIAPPSRTLCTKPLPHWYGTRTKGVIPSSSPAHDNWLASSMDSVECSKSMKSESNPTFLAI